MTGNQGAVHVKARSVVQRLGHNDGEAHREYKDWHIQIRSGAAFVSVWCSAGMVFLSLHKVPVFYRPGPWEKYLDLVFQRLHVSERAPAVSETYRSRQPVPESLETSRDN